VGEKVNRVEGVLATRADEELSQFLNAEAELWLAATSCCIIRNTFPHCSGKVL